jgi:hypothetical protein
MARWKKPVILTALFIPLAVAAIGVYNIPPVQERLAWRVEAVKARVKYAIAPPQEAIFVPQGPNLELPPPVVQIIKKTDTPLPTDVPFETVAIPEPASTPTLVPTSLPEKIQLAGVRHEYQTWNNCGPATLSMALSYWGWEGDQRPVASFTKPNPRDKNVMPEELSAFVVEHTAFEVVFRVGGNLQLIKEFLATGFPVMVEKGIEGEDGWLGHYVLVTGYDDGDRKFSMMDSLRGPDQTLAFADFHKQWRSFNYTYLVVYPGEREAQVMEMLGSQAEASRNYQQGAQKALEEISSSSGQDLYFAWFNLGTNLVAVGDYPGAAAAYDQAFTLYPGLPPAERPWRMLWYQTGPYSAYFHTGRYQDVIDLATTTLTAMSEPVLEESYFWRARAREASGDIEGAIKDLRTSLNHNSGFGPGLEALKRLTGEN